MSGICYLQLISPLKVIHCLRRVLNSHPLGKSLDLTNAFINCFYVSFRTSIYEFLGIISLMSSATIFTCAHIAILLLSLDFFYQSSYCNFVVIIAFLWHPLLLVPILYYAWSAQEIFVASHMCWFFKFKNFPMVFLVYELNLDELKRLFNRRETTWNINNVL